MRQITDESGDVLMAQIFDPYAHLYTRNGTQLGTFGFTGEQTDSNSLIYLRARYYNPSTGRLRHAVHAYMDPSCQEMNPYQYGASNPVMYTDPSGLICLIPWAPNGFHLRLNEGCGFNNNSSSSSPTSTVPPSQTYTPTPTLTPTCTPNPTATPTLEPTATPLSPANTPSITGNRDGYGYIIEAMERVRTKFEDAGALRAYNLIFDNGNIPVFHVSDAPTISCSNASNYEGGCTSLNGRLITMSAPPISINGVPYTVQVIIHELGHVLLNRHMALFPVPPPTPGPQEGWAPPDWHSIRQFAAYGIGDWQDVDLGEMTRVGGRVAPDQPREVFADSFLGWVTSHDNSLNAYKFMDWFVRYRVG